MDFPESFIHQITPILGSDVDAFLQALQTKSTTSIRKNDKIDISYTHPVPWCKSAYYLNERPLFTADPLLHAGAYYVQEASSMFLEQVVKQYISTPVNMLDLCAAPGGKSTHLSSLLPEGSLLISNEIIRSRAYVLAENLIKWGNHNVMVTNNEPKDFSDLYSFFDAVLVDAPCSGEGMFRKDEGAISEWSTDNVKKCVARQRDILSSVWSSIKENGLLIYSTCTFNRFENEENVQWIINQLGAELLTLYIEQDWGITASDFGYRFYPHKVMGEGFFIAVLRKKSLENSACRIKTEKNKNIKVSQDVLALKNNLLQPGNFNISIDENKIKALPLSKTNEIEFLQKKLKCMFSGILLAEQKGKDFIPSINLALSKQLDITKFVTVEVDLKTALLFLQKEAIVLPETDKAYVLLLYQKLPIGWVKNLGSRCNNMYPQEWRIRMKLTV